MMMIKLKKKLILIKKKLILIKKKLILMFLLSSLPGQNKTKIKKFLLLIDLNVGDNDLYNLIVVELI